MGPVQTMIHDREEAAKKKTLKEAEANKADAQEIDSSMTLAQNDENTEMPQILSGKEFDKLSKSEKHARIEKLAQLANNEELNYDIWNINHDMINNAISKFLQTYGIMPSVNRLSKDTGIHRATITKHLKEYKDHDQHIERMQHFRFMKTDVMAKVLAQAVKGDLKAAKMYFEFMYKDARPSENVNQKRTSQQNNFIQINGVVISQETLEQIKPEHLKQIETIFRTSIPKTVSLS